MNHHFLSYAQEYRTYIGCFLFALTSVMFIVFYFCDLRGKPDHKTRFDRDDDDDDDRQSVVQQACLLAKENTSFLSYLKSLDTDASRESFPTHCRTIDFYLACKDCEEATARNDSESVVIDVNDEDF